MQNGLVSQHLKDAHCQGQHLSSLCVIANPGFISKKILPVWLQPWLACWKPTAPMTGLGRYFPLEVLGESQAGKHQHSPVSSAELLEFSSTFSTNCSRLSVTGSSFPSEAETLPRFSKGQGNHPTISQQTLPLMHPCWQILPELGFSFVTAECCAAHERHHSK